MTPEILSHEDAPCLPSVDVQAQQEHLPQKGMMISSDDVAAFSMALTTWNEHLEAADQLLGRAMSGI